MTMSPNDPMNVDYRFLGSYNFMEDIYEGATQEQQAILNRIYSMQITEDPDALAEQFLEIQRLLSSVISPSEVMTAGEVKADIEFAGGFIEGKASQYIAGFEEAKKRTLG